MRWYARPDGDKQQLRFAPQLFSGEKANDPEQVRLREFTNDTAVLLAASRVYGPWALRLDVGLPTGDLLKNRDVDNYVYPLARRPQADHPDLVSVW